MALGGFPAFAVDLELDLGVPFEDALGDFDVVDVELTIPECVQDPGFATFPGHLADVTDLPTGLGVEGSTVERS